MAERPGHHPPPDAETPGRRRLRRFGWALVVFAVATVPVAGWETSVPGGYIVLGLALVLTWLLIGGCWLVALIVALVQVKRTGRPGWRLLPLYLPLVLVPVVAVLTVSLASMDTTQRIRLEMDRAELDAYAAEVRAGRIETSDQQQTRQIGTLTISKVVERDGCVAFQIYGVGYLSNNHGYAECPGGPVDESDYSYIHLTGNWYEWSYAGSS